MRYYLLCINFTHYGPKDSESGIKEYVIFTTYKDKMEYINKTYFYGDLFEDEDSEAYFSCDEEWEKENEELVSIYGMFNLTRNKYGGYSGKKNDMIKWLNRTDYDYPDDCYYGVTLYNWDNQKELTKEETELLVKLGVAKLIAG